MPPKKATGTAAATKDKKPAAAPAHASYKGEFARHGASHDRESLFVVVARQC